MTHPEGGFYSAEDADSVIDPAQSRDERRRRFLHLAAGGNRRYRRSSPPPNGSATAYGVEARGNVQNDPHSEFAGRNILYQAHSLEETAQPL